MDLARKIGQLFMFGFDGCDSEPISSLVRELHAGGIILFRRNVESSGQVKSLLASLQDQVATAGLPQLLVSIDQEGGRVVILGPEICPATKSNWRHGDHFRLTGDTGPVAEQAEAAAAVMRDLGFNMNLAPVLDVVTVAGNEVIDDRSYGDNADVVSHLGTDYINALQRSGVIATAKHFPGHGATDVDSHKALPTISLGKEEFEDVHLRPFEKAVECGVDAVMTAHILYDKYSELPATLSGEWIGKMLRGRLGFDGVVITDDMNMLAIADNFGVEEAAVLAINAGVDILLVCGNEAIQHRAWLAVYEAAASGLIPEETIDAAVNRVLQLKQKYGLTTEVVQ